MTSADIAAKAHEIANHDGQVYAWEGGQFDLARGGFCLRFVRVVCGLAAGLLPGTIGAGAAEYAAFPWLTRYASEACRLLTRGGRGSLGTFGPVDSPEPGDIVLASPGCLAPGHIGVFLGRGLVAENTSSSRGPGTVISHVAELRVTGFARVAPPGDSDSRLLVLSPENRVIDCRPAEEDGVTRADLRAVVESLGYEVHFRQQPQGPRVYIKRPEE